MAVDFIGPFEQYKVVVDGWQVPFLSAQPRTGGNVELSLDDRFGLVLDIAQAELVVPFLANAVAIAMGYASHPGEGASVPRPHPAGPRRLLRLDWSEQADPSG
jgi:hypothetical protein